MRAGTNRDEAFAHDLRRRGLGPLAIVLLDAHRPLRPLLSQAVTFLSPLARPLLGRAMAGVERTLSSDLAYGRLLVRISRGERR